MAGGIKRAARAVRPSRSGWCCGRTAQARINVDAEFSGANAGVGRHQINPIVEEGFNQRIAAEFLLLLNNLTACIEFNGEDRCVSQRAHACVISG